MPNQQISIEKIFLAEFNCIAHKFIAITTPLNKLRASKASFIWHPGVYIYHNEKEVLKVGRHLTNSRKRALEHVGAETGKNMGIETEEADAHVTLFNLIKIEDCHWAAAVEIFLEGALGPKVKSKRMG